MREFSDGIQDYTRGVNKAEDGSKKLNDSVSEMKYDTDKLIDELFQIDIDNLTAFITAEDNIRIAAAAGDVIMDRNVGLVAGVIVLIMFAYVISVFVVHQIEREQSVIGTLYALGVKKKNLLRHYIMIPTIAAFVGGAIGLAAAFSPIGINMQTGDTYNYFSLPEFDIVYPLYLMIYALILLPVLSAVINALVINKKLSRTALSLIKNEQSQSSYRQFSLKIKNFERLFRIRQTARELRSALTVVLGMFISMLVMVLGINTYILCSNIKTQNIEDTKYEYMYLYKYSEKTMSEIDRVLKKGGILIAPNFIHKGQGFSSRIWSGILKIAGIKFEHQWTKEEYINFLNTNSWTVIKEQEMSSRNTLLYTECVRH